MSEVGGTDQVPPIIPTKLCSGCNKYLPLIEDNWLRRNTGQYAGNFYGPCKRCRLRKRVAHDDDSGYIPVTKVYPLMKELLDRCGTWEATVEFSGINGSTITEILHKRRRNVQKRTVRTLILALYERRRLDRLNGSSKRFTEARRRQGELEERLNRLTGY